MAKLTDMALPKPKKGDTEGAGIVAAPGREPKYPWGLELRLGDEEIKRLGLKPKDFDTDTVVQIIAKAECTRVSEEDTRNGGKTQSLTFQVTHMSISRASSESFKDGWDKAGADAAGAKKGG